MSRERENFGGDLRAWQLENGIKRSESLAGAENPQRGKKQKVTELKMQLSSRSELRQVVATVGNVNVRLNSGRASFEVRIPRAVNLRGSEGHSKCTLLLTDLKCAPREHFAHWSIPECFVFCTELY